VQHISIKHASRSEPTRTGSLKRSWRRGKLTLMAKLRPLFAVIGNQPLTKRSTTGGHLRTTSIRKALMYKRVGHSGLPAGT
jgi:hypothetical protein